MLASPAIPASWSSLRSSSESIPKTSPSRVFDSTTRAPRWKGWAHATGTKKLSFPWLGGRHPEVGDLARFWRLAALFLLAVFVALAIAGRGRGGSDGYAAVGEAGEAAGHARHGHPAGHAGESAAAAELTHQGLHLAELVQQLIDLGGRGAAAAGNAFLA